MTGSEILMSLLEYDGTETPVLPEEVSRYNQAQQSRSVCVCVCGLLLCGVYEGKGKLVLPGE